MNLKKYFLVLTLLGALISAPLFAADTVGVIDLQRIQFSYKKAQKIKEDVQKRRDDYLKVVEKRESKVRDAKDKGKSQEELDKMVAEIEEELRPKQMQLLEYERMMQQQLVEEVRSATKKVSKLYGVDIILDKSAVFEGGFDITDQVLEQLNKE